jgi:hypothetical protein
MHFIIYEMGVWGNTTGTIRCAAEGARRGDSQEESLAKFNRLGTDGHGVPSPYDCKGWRSKDRRYEMPYVRLARRGWDYCGGGWEGGGVIEDDAPAFGEFSEVEREDAGGLVGFTDEVEFSYYVGGVGTGEMNFEIGEGERAHGFAIGVGVVVAIEDCLPAVGDAVGADKFGLF